MIRALELTDIEIVNNLIDDNNYKVNEYELNKKAKVFIKDNEVIAFISYQLLYERAELNYIFVKNEERRKGIASKLIEYMIADCESNEVKTIDLEVNSLNKNAIKLYEKYGFKVINIRPKYYNGVDALLMIKEVRK